MMNWVMRLLWWGKVGDGSSPVIAVPPAHEFAIDFDSPLAFAVDFDSPLAFAIDVPFTSAFTVDF